MRCEEIRVLLSGLVDGELTPGEKKQAGDHMASCSDCRKEYVRVKRLKEVTEQMRYFDLPDRLWVGYWEGIYNRLERGLGWILLSLGAILLLVFACWQLLNDFFLNKQTPLLLKAGLGMTIIGLIILLVSIIRERVFSRKHDRYEEVEI